MYLPLYQSQIEHHRENARAHERAGHPPEYAARSREKAAKWAERQREFAGLLAVHDPHESIKAASDAVIRRIMRGEISY